MEDFLEGLILGFLIGCAVSFLMTEPAKADIIDLNRVDLTYERFQDGARNPLLQQVGIEPKSRFGVEVDASALKYVYMTNHIEGNMDNSQFRTVSWEYEVGVKPCSYLDLFYHHKSEHLLDTYSNEWYPSGDSIGIRLHLVRK